MAGTASGKALIAGRRGRKHKCCDGRPLRRGLWSPDEDERLKRHIQIYGACEWSRVPEMTGLERCGKSCRLRWLNYLRPDLKREPISDSEAQLIIRLHVLYGNRWSVIALFLPGRSDNEIKNFWNSYDTGKKRQMSTNKASMCTNSTGPSCSISTTPLKATSPTENISTISSTTEDYEMNYNNNYDINEYCLQNKSIINPTLFQDHEDQIHELFNNGNDELDFEQLYSNYNCSPSPSPALVTNEQSTNCVINNYPDWEFPFLNNFGTYELYNLLQTL